MKKGWEVRALAEVCQIKPPKSEARSKVSFDDMVSFVPMEYLGIDQKMLVATQSRPLSEVAGSYTYFADGDVLLAKITPCFENGKLGIAANLVNGVGFGSSEYIVFRPDASLDKEWLYYFLARESFREEGAARMTGAVGHKRVAKDFIESYPLPVPPISEQQRIVTILDEAFDSITIAKANAKVKLQNARAIFASQLQSVLSTPSEGWKLLTLEDAVDAKCSLSYGIVQPGEEYQGGMPIVRPTDLGPDVIEIDGLKRIDPALASSYKRTTLRGGDLLLCVRGATGQVSIASTALAGANVTRGIVPIVFEPSLVSQAFGYYLICSDAVQSQIRDKTYGTALMQINIGDLRKVAVPIPPLKIQDKLAANFDDLKAECERLESICRQKLTALDDLKKSLLHQAFSGQL